MTFSVHDASRLCKYPDLLFENCTAFLGEHCLQLCNVPRLWLLLKSTSDQHVPDVFKRRHFERPMSLWQCWDRHYPSETTTRMAQIQVSAPRLSTSVQSTKNNQD